uniref:Solute carrier family 15 member 1 n=1 Tax=Fundulus heteroclitus macrolepidotus TaxID=351661 RepID=H2DJW0_FUNHE|nr:oligopeptide transporter PEPT1 [Fundulus heteroclitus macrolepidotus]
MNSKKRRVTGCGYPISIFFIVVNEFCERFSYYGMRAVLVLYFKYFLRWDDDLATSFYHTFVAFCYLTPILGAIVADSWLGKFKTIIYLSIVYAIGQVAMAVSAIHDITDSNRDGTPDNLTFHVALSMVGLLLIALGTGGIKPCVAAFGGDQFGDTQEKQRRTFFSVFYLCINGGSLLSTIITPILRAQECGIHSKSKCYSLAFGVPAALMVVALVVFIMGSGMYYKAKPEGNIMLKVSKCIGFAIKNRYKHRSSQYPKREHWMDWAEEKYDKLLIAQIKISLRVLFLYIPLPMFWTLFDQKGSRWTLQATTMNGHFGSIVIQPDQMQTINPILILTLVPIMDSLIYPLIRKCGLNFTPLKKMTVGMILAALAFVCAAMVQLQIDKTLPIFPSASQSQLKLLNMENNQLEVHLPNNFTDLLLPAAQASDIQNKKLAFQQETLRRPKIISLPDGTRNTIVIVEQGPAFGYITIDDLTSKPEEGNNAIRFVNGLATDINVSAPAADFGVIESFYMSIYSLLKTGTKTIFTKNNVKQSCEYSRDFGFGSSYTFFIPSTFVFGPNCQESVTEVENIGPNTVHMALQIPQYFFITVGEVMFSVTGLEFSYSQAPSNMKAVLQAGWLLTVAVGNFIVLIVAELAKFPKQWAEYFLFASLLVVVCVIFSIMAYFYTYIDPAKIEAQFKKKVDEEEEEEESKLEMNAWPEIHATRSSGKQLKRGGRLKKSTF